MKIMLVTALTPSRSGIHEYGRYLYDASEQFKDHSFIFAADFDQTIDQALPLHSNSKVERIWVYNGVFNFFKILRLAIKEKPDVVWFNLILTSFGNKAIPAFLGLLAPIILKLFGFRCFITLHHLAAFIDFKGFRFKIRRFVLQKFAEFSEQLLALSGPSALLLDKYVEHFRSTYWFSKPLRMPLGFPHYPKGKAPEWRKHILVFGKFGSYKRLELPLEIFSLLKAADVSWSMTIAGSSHASYPGYFESFASSNSSIDGIEFKGYVPEDKLSDLFSLCGLVLLPYSSSTGVSGVCHLAAAFGVPVISAKIDDFVAMGVEEKMGIEFFQPDDAQSAVDIISRVMENECEWSDLSNRSLQASSQASMHNILGRYLNLFGTLVEGSQIAREDSRCD